MIREEEKDHSSPQIDLSHLSKIDDSIKFEPKEETEFRIKLVKPPNKSESPTEIEAEVNSKKHA